jgi:hypothetical protein
VPAIAEQTRRVAVTVIVICLIFTTFDALESMQEGLVALIFLKVLETMLAAAPVAGVARAT